MDDDPITLEFGLPPDLPRRARMPWDDIAETLRRHPGEWARIATYNQHNVATAHAFNIRSGKTAAFRYAVFEAVARRNADAKFDLWARYAGPLPNKEAKA